MVKHNKSKWQQILSEAFVQTMVLLDNLQLIISCLKIESYFFYIKEDNYFLQIDSTIW